MLPQLDQSRQAATDADTLPSHHHTLTIDDVVLIYQDAGLPRTPRTLQRYAEAGHLNAEKILTATGAKYLITPHSVDMHLTQLRQLEAQARQIATGRDLSRPVVSTFEPFTHATATTVEARPTATMPDVSRQVASPIEFTDGPTSPDKASLPAPTDRDMSRHDATGQPNIAADPQQGRVTPTQTDDRYLKSLERENDFLRRQVDTKDGQIKELTERSRETNMLVAGLQKMLSPLLGSGRDMTRDA
jgi:hypothetical protein